MEDRVRKAKELLGRRLDRLREEAGLSKTQLADDAKVDRTYIHDVLKGTANPTLDVYAKLASACGVDFEEFLAGINPDAAPLAHQPFYRMLKSILTSGVNELIQGIHVNLEAISEKAGRLRKSRESSEKSKPPPSPEKRVEGGKAARGGRR